MMRESKSYKNAKHKAMYDALMLSLIQDEDDLDRVVSDLRKRDHKEDVDPSVGSNRGKRKRISRKYSKPLNTSSASKKTSKSDIPSKSSKAANVNDADQPQNNEAAPKNNWFKQPPRPPTPDLEWNSTSYSRSLIIKKRVEDVQLGVESYQKKLNITKPQKDFPRIFAKELYTPSFEPPRVDDEDISHRKRLMRADELYKFSNGMVKKMRFGYRWCKWIRAYLKSNLISILVNGSPTNEFLMERGLRQGADDVTISHLQYADDTMFFGEWSQNNTSKLMYILKCFEEVAGLRINLRRIYLYRVGVVNDIVASLAQFMKCGVGEIPFSYPGLSIRSNMRRLAAWRQINIKFKKHLSRWKAKSMSFGGRLTLVKEDTLFWMTYGLGERLKEKKSRLYSLEREKEVLVRGRGDWDDETSYFKEPTLSITTRSRTPTRDPPYISAPAPSVTHEMTEVGRPGGEENPENSGDDQLYVVISSTLSIHEKAKLLEVLRNHKGAIAWSVTDIKGIDSSFYTHKILMEDEYMPTIQPQRRVNPNIKEVIKKEAIKLLDAELIYPISDIPWVNPVQVVPKKGGMIIVKNEMNDLIPKCTLT
nr:putative reverse transcriptase domain-containing protein [Tanacetum cinerariifolium]